MRPEYPGEHLKGNEEEDQQQQQQQDGETDEEDYRWQRIPWRLEAQAEGPSSSILHSILRSVVTLQSAPGHQERTEQA